MEPIYLPENITVTEEGENTATFEIHPYHPGYGPTVGNALRRVLLSSLPGAAITQLKITGVDHEFSTLEGVKEDAVTLILNLKKVRLTLTGSEPVEIRLRASGKKTLTASDFDTPPEITIVNGKQHIATLTDAKTTLDLICTVEQGRGYMPSEAQEGKNRETGVIALDAIFTPVQRVSFNVQNVRVGQATDYHKLTMTITTDGTITPKDALRQAASLLVDHFRELTGDFEGKLTADRPLPQEAPVEQEEMREPENTLNLLQLPSRVHNALERVGITTVEQVLELTDGQIADIPGLGAKAIEDIAHAKKLYQQRAEGQKEEGEQKEEYAA